MEDEGIKLNLNGEENHSNGHSNGTQRITLGDKNASFDDCLAGDNGVSIETDKDGDLIVERRKKGVIEIGKLE